MNKKISTKIEIKMSKRTKCAMVAEGTSARMTQISNGKKIMFLMVLFFSAITLCKAQVGTNMMQNLDFTISFHD